MYIIQQCDYISEEIKIFPDKFIYPQIYPLLQKKNYHFGMSPQDLYLMYLYISS